MNTLVFFTAFLACYIFQPLLCWSYFVDALITYTFLGMAILSFLNYVESKMNEQ